MSVDNNSVQLSQGYDVIAPKGGQAYPILCADWEFLKVQVGKISDNPWIFQNLGSVFLGAALSALAALLFGAFPETAGAQPKIIAWCVFIGGGVCGAVCYLAAFKEGETKRTNATGIVTHMAMIEARYERTNIEEINQHPISE